jgi:CubicO group peptidase (beta-lactamase class C family)
LLVESETNTEEVANPLKAGIYFGVPLSEQHRISPVYDASTAWSLIHLAVPLYLGNSPDPVLAAHSLNSSSYIARFLIGAAFEIGNLTLINSPEFQKVYSPATAGFASARGLAKLGAALANKGDTTDSLLLMWLQANMMELGSSPRKQWTRFFNPLLQFMNIVYLTFMTTDTDVVTGSKIAWTQVGWAKGGLPTTMKLMDGFYGWTGLGGSGFLFSPEKQAAVGFTVTGLIE